MTNAVQCLLNLEIAEYPGLIVAMRFVAVARQGNTEDCIDSRRFVLYERRVV